MVRVKRLILQTSLFWFACIITPVSMASADLRVGVVDLQDALNQTNDGRKAKAKLQKIFKQRQKGLDKKQKELKVMKDDIEKKRSVLSREALRGKLEEYQRSFVRLQKTYVEYQRELAKKEGQLTKGIIEKMQDILREIGKKEGYTLIIERNEGGIVWVPNKLDLTQRVVKQYNKKSGS